MDRSKIRKAEMNRIVVVGTSCSGKTTLAGNIAEILEIPHIELDALHWGPNWTIKADFEEKVAEAVQQPAWVADGNYRKVREQIWDKADTIIWLNYSFTLVFYRALKRTFKRVFTGEKIFAGNKENLFTSLFSSDSILWWVIKTHKMRRKEYSQLSENKNLSHLKIIQLDNQNEADTFVQNIKKYLGRN